MSWKVLHDVFAVKLGVLFGEKRDQRVALQRNRTNKTDRDVEIYRGDLAHGVMETKQSCGLPSASQRARQPVVFRSRARRPTFCLSRQGVRGDFLLPLGGLGDAHPALHKGDLLY